MNINSIRQGIVAQLIALPAVTALVNTDNIFPHELAAVRNAKYPCINFAIPPGSPVTTEFIEIAGIRMLIYVWDTKGYDKGHEVQDVIKPGLHRQKFTANNVNMVPRMTADDAELYDDITQLHGVITTWKIRAIG